MQCDDFRDVLELFEEVDLCDVGSLHCTVQVLQVYLLQSIQLTALTHHFEHLHRGREGGREREREKRGGGERETERERHAERDRDRAEHGQFLNAVVGIYELYIHKT